MAFTVGTKLGSHEITGLLGKGGMGDVYRARDTRLKREVAIKTLPEEFAQNDDRLIRFQHEAEVLASLNHPNIAAIYSLEEFEASRFLILELVEGETVADRLSRGRVPVDEALRISTQVLAALGAAHRAGIVHRDLKPANIMVRRDGYVKVLDFGIAKRTALEGDAVSIPTAVSLAGEILGTVAYMSPEQISGHTVDQRSDLFAFGIILYEMLTCQHPWPRISTIDTLHAILHDDPSPVDSDSSCTYLARIIEKLLCKNAAERYPSAEAVIEALEKRGVEQAAVAGFQPARKSVKSIAILPFLFLNEVEERKAVSLGFADSLITMLGSLEDLVVLPIAKVLNYAAGADPLRACRDLSVRHVLQGSVQKAGTRWRVSIQLFDGVAEKSVLSEKHDFVMENVFDVQDEIGRRVVESLQTRFSRGMSKSRDRYSSDPEAYNEFMAGLRESYSIRSETLNSAIRHLSRAVERDPQFALAHAWLSYVSMNIYFSFDPGPARLEAAEHHYHQALAIDPALPEANLARAFILWSAAKNFQHAEAIAALEQLLAVQPNSEQAHNRMSSICIHIGRFEEARIAHEKVQRAHPKNPEFLYLFSGDFERAETAGEAWIRESPGDHSALWFHPQPPLMMGNVDLAERRLSAGLKAYPDESWFISMQGMIHARRNESGPAHECALRALASPRTTGHTHHTHYQVACIYALLGKTEEAMGWLERTADTGFPCWPFFNLDPHLENLRELPAFKKLVDDLKRKYTAIKIQRL